MNAFLELAERQAPRKARERAVEKRAQTRAEQALTEREQQFRRWRQWRRERSQALLEGSYADAARGLLDLLDRLTLADGQQLVAHVRAGPWIAADADTRFLVLATIDNVLVELRERTGLPPFDDPLSGEPNNVFLMLREVLA